MSIPLNPGALALIAFSLVACKNEEKSPDTGAPTAVVAAPTTKVPLAGRPDLSPEMPRTPLGAVPTPEDLEEEAEKTVLVDNLEAELDRLEAEISDGP